MKHTKRFPLSFLVVGCFAIALLTAGCGSKEESTGDQSKTDTPPASDHPTAKKTAPVATPVPEGMESHVGLAYALPDGWTSKTPSSRMRIAEYGLPGNEEGEVILFHFGTGGGGGIEANLRRWAGQFQMADGSDSWDQADRDSFEAGQLKIHTIEVKGRYVSSMPGGARSYNESDWRLLGGIIEGPGGPWFFKGVGPEKVILDIREPFMDMLKSAVAS